MEYQLLPKPLPPHLLQQPLGRLLRPSPQARTIPRQQVLQAVAAALLLQCVTTLLGGIAEEASSPTLLDAALAQPWVALVVAAAAAATVGASPRKSRLPY